jgi:hypothetical protein
MEWYRLLPPSLGEAAYKSGNKMAWSKEGALRVIALLEENGYSIDGVDVWLPTKPGPTPLIRDWDSEKIDSKALPATPAAFVCSFQLNSPEGATPGLEPVFNIWAEPMEKASRYPLKRIP